MRALKWLVIVGILGGLGWLGAGPLASYWRERNRVQYREAEVTQGQIVAVVNATGTIKPVRSVQVGTFVSGPIIEIRVDFNDEVKKGDLLARIDPRLYAASVARDRALLITREAEVKQIQARLQQAINDQKRSEKLRARDPGFISDSEMDQFRFARESLDAQFKVAEATVLQAKANLDTSVANMEYTEIRSPVDGIVIDRKIDPGQTVAATFQTPDLFIVAPDLRKEIHLFASVDEADIGLVEQARRNGLPVRFTVDAHPDDLFEGKIFQVRKNSSTVQNVVTYPVVVAAPNPDLKLLPGMTANISFQVGEKSDVLRIPNSALRFFPQREQVRQEDRRLLEGAAQTAEVDELAVANRSAAEKADSRRRRNLRHVWVVEGDSLRAIEVETGISNSRFTQLVSGELRAGQKLITGIQPKN